MSKQKRDFDGMETRRQEAAKLFADNVKQSEVARQLKVSRQSVSRWFEAWKQGGTKQLEGAGRAGRIGKLTEQDTKRIVEALKQGPRANGIASAMWTLPRIRKLIKQLTGANYGISGVWYVMQRLGWSVQRPGRRAAQRDEKAIEQWQKQTWPALKKSPAEKTE